MFGPCKYKKNIFAGIGQNIKSTNNYETCTTLSFLLSEPLDGITLWSATTLSNAATDSATYP